MIRKLNLKEPYKSLLTRVRNEDLYGHDLKETLKKVSSVFVEELASLLEFQEKTVSTPMGREFRGSQCKSDDILIVSTFEDNEIMATEIGSFFGNVSYGKLEAVRKKDETCGWSASVHYTEFPKDIKNVNTVIFCKTVLATGCTAKSIIKATCELVRPTKIVILSVIGSNQAVEEISEEFGWINIDFVFADIDEVKDGMLIPGVGDIEKRLSKLIQ